MRRLIQKIFGSGKYHGHSAAYLAVWISLLILTVITVSFSYFNFGDWNVFVAMLIATTKAALVCLYFMHLKYDNRVNQVVFVSAFFFLAIFIGLTASDELFRREERPVFVQEEAAPSGGDLLQFKAATPELLATGKQTFAMQCSVCHGSEGKGDGPGAVALNPKPRDFTSGYWRFGGGAFRVFKTISEGSPGTAMAAFSNLSVKERMALSHFVRSLGPKQEEDKPEDIPVAGASVGASQEVKTQKIPVSFAIQRIIEEEAKARK